MELPKATLELVCATFDSYLRSTKHTDLFRDEIITLFELYIKWMESAPGGESSPGAVVLPFVRKGDGDYPG